MTSNVRFGRIRITTSTCFEGIPDEVNRAIEGLSVPCLYINPYATGYTIVERKPLGPFAGYVVYVKHFLEALAIKDQAAAKYWAHIGYPRTIKHEFLFPAKIIQVEIPPMDFLQVPYSFIKSYKP